MVHSCLCYGMHVGIDLRFFARGVALWIGRGGLVAGRDTALGSCDALKVTCVYLRTRISTNFFQHLGLDVSPADNGYV